MYSLTIFFSLAIISLVGDDKTIQSQHYNFVPISDIAKLEPRKTVDVLAVVLVNACLSLSFVVT